MERAKIRPEDVTYTLTIEDEDIPVRGNAMASGDDEADEAYENEIIARLDSGDLWAWCFVKVTAEWRGFKGWDGLGGCSYADEADFKRGGYYEDMKARAFDDLVATVEDVRKRVCA